MQPRTKVTSRFHLLRAEEKELHSECLRMIARAGDVTHFGCLYLIDADGDGATKLGITEQDEIARRATNLQTGNARALRIVTVCFFYSKEIAGEVERELKRRHAHRRAEGGTEWFYIDRDELRSDIAAVCHELFVTQLRSNANGATPIRPELAEYFYGLLMFDLRGGELCHQWNATPTCDPRYTNGEIMQPHAVDLRPTNEDSSASKQSVWDRMMKALGIS